jgi:hypothetical protein
MLTFGVSRYPKEEDARPAKGAASTKTHRDAALERFNYFRFSPSAFRLFIYASFVPFCG